MRVLQVIDNLEIGGAQRLLDVFHSAGGPGDTTEILSMGPAEDPFNHRLSQRGVKVHLAPDCRLWRLSTYLRIARAVRQIRPDVLHVHLTYSTIIGAVAGWMARCPVVATIHHTNTVSIGGIRAKVMLFLETLTIRLFVDRVIFVGTAASDANRHRFGSTPMVTIDNVVEPADLGLRARRQELRATLGAGEGDVVVLSTARLHAIKNIGLLLDAFASVRRSQPQARLWVCGAGPMAGELEEKAKILQLGAAVQFLGGRDDIPALLQAADIFVLSSDAEGLPLALLEAMAAGMPVVVTAVGSVPDYAGGGVGLMVPARSVGEFAAALEAMVSDADLRQRSGRAAAERARVFTDMVGWRKALEVEYAKAVDGRGV